MAVLADGPGAFLAAGCTFRRAIVKDAVPVTLRLVRLGTRPQPIRRRSGQAFQRMAHRPDDALQPVQGAHRGQDVRGVGPLPPTAGQQAPLLGKRQHLISPKLRACSLPAQQGEVAIGVAVLTTIIRTAKPASVRIV